MLWLSKAVRCSWCLALLVMLLAGCGYHLEKMESEPTHRERLYVELFANQSRRAFENDALTADMVAKFSRSGRFNVVEEPSSADLVLSGSITRYDAGAIAFSRQDVIMAYRVEIALNSTLRRVADGGRIIWRGDLVAGKDYAAVTDRMEQLVMERSAAALVCERLANDLYARIVDEFDWPVVPVSP